MKRFFMLSLLVVAIFFFTSCTPEWELVEEAVLKSAKYHSGRFSVSPYWELIFDSGAVMRINASQNQIMFVGKTYGIYHKEENSMHNEAYTIRLRK